MIWMLWVFVPQNYKQKFSRASTKTKSYLFMRKSYIVFLPVILITSNVQNRNIFPSAAQKRAFQGQNHHFSLQKQRKFACTKVPATDFIVEN